MDAIETYRGFINTWECDENNHLNVRFYFQRFEIAATHLFAISGITWDPDWVMSRHVRYLKECHGDQMLVGRSFRPSTIPDAVAHMLCDAETGDVVATALDTLGPSAEKALSLAKIPLAEPDKTVGPRGVKGGQDTEERTGSILVDGGHIVIDRTVVTGAHVGADNRFHAYHMVGRVSDGVSHSWAHAGFTGQWLNANNCGRVAVEINLSIFERPLIGRPLHVVSGIRSVSRSVIGFRHILVDTLSDRVYAIANNVGVIMDLEKRKAVRVPDDSQALADSRVIRG